MPSELNQEDIDKRIMAVILRCAEVQNAAEFGELAEGALREVFPHDMMICGIGGVSRQGNYVHKLLNYNFTYDCYKYYEALMHQDGRVDSPLMKKWRETQEPVLFQSGRDDDQLPEDWVQLFKKHHMRNVIGHGVLDLTGTFSSFFIFSQVPGEIGPQHAFLVKILTPHLHLALARALMDIEEFQVLLGNTKKRLSDRQREILYWIHEGKTNWEIAKILELTELNVKYHIDQIFVKLEVRSRTQAVAKARDLGWLLVPRS